MGNRRTAVMAGMAVLATCFSWGFSFNDIHYWVGEGSKKCGVVIDWGKAGQIRAWGYKWTSSTSGCGTNLVEIVRRIAHDDARLTYDAAHDFLGYDLNDCHPVWSKAAGTCSDPAAFAACGTGDVRWQVFGPFSATTSPPGKALPNSCTASGLEPQNGEWFYLRPASDGASIPLAAPEPAESPYGYEVVEFSTDSRAYSLSSSVLGRPAQANLSAQVINGTSDSGAVISPAYPPSTINQVFTLESYDDDEKKPPFIEIKFDHDVIDDPMNPYGIDFIVFGNDFGTLRSQAGVSLTSNPALVEFSGNGNHEDALVMVSQDGETWYAYEDGPYADAPMPTLGHEYAPTCPNKTLFSGNEWWGDATQATRPLPPSLSIKNLEGLTLAEVCARYNGSAGGMGYDLSGLDLPRNKDGRKWIRYVRIEALYGYKYDEDGEWDGDFGYSAPEIDAVADVAPVSAYEKWVEEHYTDWATAWQTNVTGAGAVAANGQLNALNFAWGLSPSDSVSSAVPFEITDFVKGDDVHTIMMHSPRRMDNAGGVVVQTTDSLTSGWKTVVPTLTSSVKEGDVYVNTLTVPADAGAFFKLVVPTE